MKISQAIIVKNEEKNIVQALSWGKGVVSEQIVVDTGSTDRTVEIAKSMGAKVYFFPWEDDFSKARNFAISKCKYPWIAMLDADEYFPEEDAKKIKYYIGLIDDNPKVHGILTAIANLGENGQVESVDNTIRLFRNRKDIFYRRAIHEQLTLAGGEDFFSANCNKDLTVIHTGYQSAVFTEKIQSNRNLNILKKELEKNPEDFEMHIYTGIEYSLRKMWKEALEHYRKVYPNMPKDYENYKIILSMGMSEHLNALHQWSVEDKSKMEELTKEAEELVELGRKIIPEDADYLYQLSIMHYLNHRYDKVIPLLLEAFKKTEDVGEGTVSQRFLAGIISAYGMLADSYMNTGNYKEAVHYATVVLKEKPQEVEILRILLFTFYLSHTPWEEVRQFLLPMYGEAMSSVEVLANKLGYATEASSKESR